MLRIPNVPTLGEAAPSSAEALEATVRRQEAEIRSLCAELLERYEEATFVYRLSERIASERGEAAIARLVLEEVAGLLGAERGALWLAEERELALAAWTPHDAVLDPAYAALSEEAAGSAVGRGAAWLREPAGDASSAVAVPLPQPGTEPLGALVLQGRSGGRSYRTGEVKLLTAIAALASAFIRNDRLSEKARRAEARAREDEIARQVHRGLLPHQEPEFLGIEVSSGFLAAEGVGGDYYGYVPMADGSLGLAMADVSGHGVGAALYMATAKGAIQSEGRRILSPAELLAQTNEVLLGDFSSMDMFATSVFLRFLPGGRRLVYSNAGHNPPLLLRGGSETVPLDRGGPALGILPRLRYVEEGLDLVEGDLLVVYTDGVVEARDASGEFFGLDRLIETAHALRGGDADAVRAGILGALAAFTGPLPPRDDVTLVVARVVSDEDPGVPAEEGP